MTSARLRQVVNARPFRSFRICMSNGQEHVVRHPELVAVIPRDDTAYFYHDDGAVSVLEAIREARSPTPCGSEDFE